MTAPADQAMRSRILARLPADEAAWLTRRLPADDAWNSHARDQAVHAALALFPSSWPTQAARMVERAFDLYLATDWIIDRENGSPPARDSRRCALYQLAFANDGRRLGWRRIYDIVTLQSDRRNIATEAVCPS
jgi:hypothetical protein